MSHASARPGRFGWRAGLALVVVAGVLATIAVLLLCFLYGGAAPKPPAPPEIALDGADPELAAAIHAARDKVLADPKSSTAWGTLGMVLLANDFFPQADACLARAAELNLAEPRWLYLRAWGLLRTDREAGAKILRQAADLCEHIGKYDSTPWLLLAEVYMEQDDREQVEALCRRVLEHEPDNPRAHCDLGMIELTHNDVEAGIPHLLRAAESPFTRHHAFTQLAAAYQRRGDDTSAAEYTQRAEKAPPDLPWRDPFLAPLGEMALGRQSRLKKAQQLESEERFPEEAALLRKMTEDYRDDRSFVALGIVLTKMGQLDEAGRSFREAATLAPRTVNAYYYLCVVLYQQGEGLQKAGDPKAAAEKYQAAADAARRTTELKPDHALAHYYLGLALKQLGNRKAAIESLRTAVRCRPEMADLHLALGETLAEDGQKAEALVHLQQACDFAAPDDPRPRAALERVQTAQKP
jgi:tetratricopeptide (TPR) repeat protein